MTWNGRGSGELCCSNTLESTIKKSQNLSLSITILYRLYFNLSTSIVVFYSIGTK